MRERKERVKRERERERVRERERERDRDARPGGRGVFILSESNKSVSSLRQLFPLRHADRGLVTGNANPMHQCCELLVGCSPILFFNSSPPFGDVDPLLVEDQSLCWEDGNRCRLWAQDRSTPPGVNCGPFSFSDGLPPREGAVKRVQKKHDVSRAPCISM